MVFKIKTKLRSGASMWSQSKATGGGGGGGGGWQGGGAGGGGSGKLTWKMG